MSDNKESYKQIIKATSIFGGVQVIQIMVGIVRSKFIAVLLGPAGMGIAGLLGTTINFMGSLTNFGLGTSAVKNIAEAFGTQDEERIAKVTTVIRKLVWFTGLLGMLLTIVLSPWLSQLTFGNKDYTISFIVLSIVLLFNQLNAGQRVVLQGTRKIGYLSKASILGSVLGLLTTIPLYYLYGIKGIVPAIIIGSFTTLALTWYFSQKVTIQRVSVTKKELTSEGKQMITMGFMISLSGLISVGVSYLVRIFISRYGGVDDVGLYTAGFVIITTYVGMVFTAMGTDYYPRLAAVAHDIKERNKIINHQAEIALLIVGPIIVVFLVFINWFIVLLYSHKFIPIYHMLMYAALGMLFRAASWSIGFLFLAKGESKLFFWNELITNVYSLAFNILGYYWMGLTGLGIAFFVSYIIHLIQMFFVTKFKYSFRFETAFTKIFIILLLLTLGTFLVIQFSSVEPLKYIGGIFFIIITTLYAFYELNNRIHLKDVLNQLRNNFYGRK